MANRYIVFDVETPNALNNRISAIGIAVIEDRKLIQEFYSLVNPETHFDNFNIKLTGITPESVKAQPTFPEMWATIKPLMSSGLVIAHNAAFDISVLSKCLRDYKIEWIPYIYYACTCRMGREYISDVPNFKLNTLCDAFGISLPHHHNALDDAKACASILLHYLNLSIYPEDHIRSYDFLKRAEKSPHSPKRSSETQQLLALKELLKTISEDGILQDREAESLQLWIQENENLKGHFPFDKIFDVVSSAMADGVLTESERTSLLSLFEKITDPLSVVCDCSNFDINGKTFCLSGDFQFGSRAEVEAHFNKLGGIASNSVTKKTAYLIVGSKGSSQWSTGNYGTKVKKALELQEKGIAIQIIKEEDIF